MKLLKKLSLLSLLILGLASCESFSFITTETKNYEVNIHTSENPNITVTTKDREAYSASDIVDAVADSVVEISTTTISGSGFRQTISSGAGSGVILDDAGYIITNHHVIEGATTVNVILRDSTVFSANIVASDAEIDIAVLSINPGEKELTYATIGNSDSLRVAEDILVIGNPLGSLGGSVTKGIVSALNRDVTIDDYTMTLLQIDAAVNPGNSGGALFNMYGELVGIVNAKSTGEEIDGIGFAIPINKAINAFTDLLEYGYIKGRVYLDIETVYVATNSMDHIYYGYAVGLYVVTSNDANFQKYDIINKFGDYEINSQADLNLALRKYNPGDSVTINITRNKTAMDITITLVEYSI